MVPKGVHTSLYPELASMLLYMAKGLYRGDQIKDFELGGYPGLSGWTKCNHKGPWN